MLTFQSDSTSASKIKNASITKVKRIAQPGGESFNMFTVNQEINFNMKRHLK